jgi:hypothetical protein
MPTKQGPDEPFDLAVEAERQVEPEPDDTDFLVPASRPGTGSRDPDPLRRAVQNMIGGLGPQIDAARRGRVLSRRVGYFWEIVKGKPEEGYNYQFKSNRSAVVINGENTFEAASLEEVAQKLERGREMLRTGRWDKYVQQHLDKLNR